MKLQNIKYVLELRCKKCNKSIELPENTQIIEHRNRDCGVRFNFGDINHTCEVAK